MRVPYAAPSYGQPEIDAVVRVLENPSQIVAGPAVEEFERRIAGLFGQSHGLMVNSGSSANLLALASLGLPPGAKVVTPALTFATTVAPILQLGFEPVFVDVDPETYVVDAGEVEGVTREVRVDALLIPLLLGNIPNLHGAFFLGPLLILDCCDTLGGRWAGEPVGDYADITTTSFYASHVITGAGGGGMACFSIPGDHARARLMAYWGRASTLYGHGEASEDMERRYGGMTFDGIGAYDAKFQFLLQGYNMQPLELQAAFGLAQLDRLAEFTRIRAEHFATLRAFVEPMADVFVLPKVLPGAEPNWLAFPLQVRDGAPFTRQELAVHLEAAGIQTRPIMAGNILRQPGYLGADAGRFPGADQVMRNGLLLGCHQGLTSEQVAYMCEQIVDFVDGCRGLWVPIPGGT